MLRGPVFEFSESKKEEREKRTLGESLHCFCVCLPKIESLYANQADLELISLLPQPPEGLDSRYVLAHLA